MSDNSTPASEAMHQLSPHLVCEGAAEAIAFYEAAFGAHELIRLADPNGKLMHACVSINDSSVMLVDEYVELGVLSPKRLNGTPVTIHLVVPDVDAAFDRAVAAGATVKMPLEDMFWGDRYGVIEDPFGHLWSLATPQRTLTNAELIDAVTAHEGQ